MNHPIDPNKRKELRELKSSIFFKTTMYRERLGEVVLKIARTL